MKEKVQRVIAAILLSAAVVSIPYSAGSGGKGEEKQWVSHQGQQNTLQILFRRYSQWIQLADHRWADRAGSYVATVNVNKHPALLWHHFSLTPPLPFVQWVMATWYCLSGDILLATEHPNLAISVRSVCNKKRADQGAGAVPTDEP